MPSDTALPLAGSPHLHLTHPTASECFHIWRLVYPSWGDSLTLDQFLEESALLLTVPLAKDGGMTMWILVDESLSPDERPILSSCESFKKRALLADGNGGVEDVVVHAVASVFCDPAYRGRGYGQTMMRKLKQKLNTWQVEQGEQCVGSMLYSDIGKEYYTKLGWKPASNNMHLEFPAHEEIARNGESQVHAVLDSDLDFLCSRDENFLRERLHRTKSKHRTLIIAPTAEHMRWHHAKEDFVCKQKSFSLPGQEVRGVMIRNETQQSALKMWAIWTRRFYGDPETANKDNTLYILRLVLSPDDPSEQEKAKMRSDLKLLIRACQTEASKLHFGSVKLWDPSPLTLELLGGTDIDYCLIEREEDGIASVAWHDDDDEVPALSSNEKYAWC